MLVFDEIKDYMTFSEEDAEHLVRLRPHVVPQFETIVNAFYTALNNNPRTKAVFESEEQVERLRKSLMLWLDELFEGKYDDAYLQRRARIGRAHVAVGLLPHFMFGAMNVIRSHIVEVIEQDTDAHLHHGYTQAVNRILDLELTIMVQSYWDNMMEMKLKVPAALASGLAHEIRNPLNALALNITLLERKMRTLDEEASQAAPILEAMRSEIRRITNLTTEIMDFAKPISIDQRWCSAEHLVDMVRTNLGHTMEASGIEFLTSVQGHDAVFCDSDRLKQAILNLLTNAVEAIQTTPGRIEFHIRNDASGTTITVSDTGEGMTPAMQYRMFDLFFTSKTTGTGLGLAIVRKIVEAHEGALDVTSKIGSGTTFTIYLPRPSLAPGPEVESWQSPHLIQ